MVIEIIEAIFIEALEEAIKCLERDTEALKRLATLLRERKGGERGG